MKRFGLYSVANGAAFAAAWMQRLAIGWAVWNATSSAMMLGVLALCDLGPALLLGPVGGLLGDRFGARRVIVWAQGAIVLLTLGMAFLIWREVAFWALMLVAALIGSAVAVADAPRASIVVKLVDPGHAASAVALTAVVINCARFVGPALAGGIAAVAGLPLVVLTASLAGIPLLVFAASLKNIDFTPKKTSSNWVGDLADGLKYARTHSVIGAVLLNFFVSAFLARGIYELVPGLADARFGGGFGAASTLTTAIGLGAISAGLLMTRSKNAGTAETASFAAAIASGLAVILLSLTTNFMIAMMVAVVLGFVISLTAISAQIAVQLAADEAMRSRVLSLWALVIRVGPASGAMLIGSIADWTGFGTPLLLSGGTATLLAAVFWTVFRRGRMMQS